MAGGINDMSIIWTISTIFIVLGISIPLVQAGFGEQITTNANVNATRDTMVQEIYGNPNPLTGWQILVSILSMFTWTFGALPFFIDFFILLPMRIVFAFIVIRNIIGGGG